jgi:hypothetical protein
MTMLFGPPVKSQISGAFYSASQKQPTGGCPKRKRRTIHGANESRASDDVAPDESYVSRRRSGGDGCPGCVGRRASPKKRRGKVSTDANAMFIKDKEVQGVFMRMTKSLSENLLVTP